VSFAISVEDIGVPRGRERVVAQSALFALGPTLFRARFPPVLGAGTVINPIIKVVTTVAILAAVGIFIVKPVLETTDKAVNSVRDQVHQAQQQGSNASDNFDLNFSRTRAQSFASSLQSGWPAAARAVKGCVHSAGTSAQAMAVCENLGERLVTSVQSDRSFALSYSTSLAAQGDTAAAQRVRDCVKHAGFHAAAMNRCSKLADSLLFG
jgi:hypothetical protein